MKVVQTSIVPPGIGVGIVARSRLSRHLAEISHRRLALVRAPAGFGKSTLLQQWQAALAAGGQQTAWLSLDRHISDIMSHIISALCQGLSEFEDRLAAHLVKGEFVTTHGELAAVVECLSERDEHTFLFIDDAHFLPSEEMKVLERLIDRLPTNAHVAMASREMPDLPLARLRVLGALFEVGMNELRFTVDETRQLLTSDAHDELSETEIANLVERTEGWVAGLRLAGLTMSQGSNCAKLIASFSGSKSVIADFFSEDVFGSQPPDIQEFLLRTCLLERFSADLCNAVTGGTNSCEMLNRIETSGLFLIRLDEDGTWFRYHGLFAGFLSRRLTDMNRDTVAQIHLTASKWYYEIDLVVEALDHAVNAGSQAWLAEMLEETCEELVYRGKLIFVVGLSERLDRTILLKYPKILLAIAWLRIRNLQIDEARVAIDQATRRIAELGNEGATTDELRALQTMLDHRELMLAAAMDDFSKAEERAAALLRSSEIKPYIACTLYGQTIRAQREQFKLSQFERFEAKARAVLEKSKYKFAFVAQQAIVGLTLFYMGKNEAAARALEYGICQAIDFAGENSALAALPALPLAAVAYDGNDLQRAASLIGDHLSVARDFAFSDELLAAYMIAPRLHFARGDMNAAFQALDEAKLVALETGLDRMITHVMAERVRLLLRTGHTERAAEVARQGGLPTDSRAVFPQMNSTTTNEVMASTWVRLAMQTGDIGDALQVTQRWKQFCFHRGATRHLMIWNLLHAQLLLTTGDSRAAQRSLREALVIAAEGRNIRIFLDEGVRIQELLAEAYESGPITKHPADLFAFDLLAAFENRPKGRIVEDEDEMVGDDGGIDGKMTGREIEILGCVASGLRNKEIGDRLGLTEGSVKWYMQRIYDKVGTRRRSVAVERARQFGFLQ